MEPGDNEKQNPEKSYTNKCKKQIACTYGYKLVYFHDKLSKPFKTLLGEDAIDNFIISIIK